MNERIYSEIKRRILNLEYEPGQNLNIKEIAKELGVSQTPIREVLLRLEWEKLVLIVPRMGIQVTTIDFKELKSIYQSRILIEGEIGRLAAQNITDLHLLDMKRLLEKCKRITGDNAREELVKLNSDFRAILFEAADCPTLQEISDFLYYQTLRVWHLTFNENDIASEVNMEVQELENTIQALVQKDQAITRELRQKIIMGWVGRLQKYYTRF